MTMNRLILGNDWEIMKTPDKESVDNDGLESIETIRLNVNGIVQKL